MTSPRILPCGDGAVSVDFGNVIDLAVNRQVRALDRALSAAPFPGVVECVPTYRALLVVFDPVATDCEGLVRHLATLARVEVGASEPARRWRVPVAYGGAFGMDFEDHAAACGLSASAVIEAHTAVVYTVMMIGFLPGFAYLGGLDPRLARPRRSVPRPRIPANSISIGGAQTAVGTVEGPSGWHLIGRTPARAFQRGREPVFLFEQGDEIVFAPIGATEFDRLSAAAAAGDPVVERTR